MIDTHVPGDADQIADAAEWLDPTLKDRADGSSNATALLPHAVYAHWYGASSEEYRTLLADLTDAADEIVPMARDSAEKLRSYAGQIRRMKSDFAQHRDDARAAGLTVSGTQIQPPVDNIGYCPGDESDPQWDAYQDYLDLVDVYNEIATDVGSWWGELEAWVADNLVAFLGTMPTSTGASTLLDTLAGANQGLIELYLENRQRQIDADMADLRTQAGQLRTDAAEFARELKSGNPAVRAAAEAANPPDMRVRANVLDDVADALGRGARHLPFIGPVLDVVFFGADVAGGRSPSSAGVEVLAGIGGAALVGVAVAGAPVTLTVGAVVVGGALIGMGAAWAYENWVPQDVRESIDAGLENAWDATTDFAEDAWDAVFG